MSDCIREHTVSEVCEGCRRTDYRELLIGCGTDRTHKLIAPGGPRKWQKLTTLDSNPDYNPDVVYNLFAGNSEASVDPIVKLELAGGTKAQVAEAWEFYYTFKYRMPLLDSRFDELHAYEVIEHTWQQGDWRTLLRQFNDYWRVLKPGGHLLATTPCYKSIWAWGDPSHRAVVNEGTLVFVDRKSYWGGVAMTPMTDFAQIYRGDFEPVAMGHVTDGKPSGADHDRCQFVFVLKAHKPIREKP